MKAEIVECRPSRRYLAVAIDDGDRDALESKAWTFTGHVMDGGGSRRRPVAIVESGIVRGPTRAHGGKWRLGVQMNKPTWARFEAHEIDATDVLRKVGIKVDTEGRARKETATMKQAKVMTKAAGAVGKMVKALEDGARHAHALGNDDEARDLRRRATTAKFLIAENVRQTNPEHLLRGFRGMGVPLLSNRHELPDDRDLGGL